MIEISQRCKRKWCPYCARQLAAQRTAELVHIVERFRWPLFVTLTMRNVSDLTPSAVRGLRRAFGKLRHRKLWKDRVLGGVAAVEVTNEGNGWHPHLHVVCDCKWLAIHAPAPQRGDSVPAIKAKCKAASQELEAVWSKILKQPTSSVRVKRADRTTISKEVLKYTVKSEDLLTSEGSAGDLIRALESCRLMTTFGQAHGQCVKDVRIEAKAAAKLKRAEMLAELEPRCHCGGEEFMPVDLVHDNYLDRWINSPGGPLPRPKSRQ